MKNSTKTGILIFVLFEIAAAVCYAYAQDSYAIGACAIGIIILLISLISGASKKSESDVNEVESPGEVIAKEVPDMEEIDADKIKGLLSQLFIYEAKIKPSEDVQTIISAHEKLLIVLEDLNEYEPKILNRVCPDFDSKLLELNTNWIKFKEDHKDIDITILKKSIDREYDKYLKSIENVEALSERTTLITRFFNKYIELPNLPEEANDYCVNLLNHFLQETPIVRRNMEETSDRKSVEVVTEVLGESPEELTAGEVIAEEVITGEEIPAKDTEEIKEPAVTYDDLRAPETVMDLTWYADGPLKNYVEDEIELLKEDKSYKFTLKALPKEPSLISIFDNLGEALEPFPELSSEDVSYASLTPDQRASYLAWMKNMEESNADVSYAQLFTKGLERYLLTTDKYEEAFNMCLKLRSLYGSNRAYDNHIIKLLTVTAIINKRRDMLIKLLDIKDLKLTPLILSGMAVLDVPLSIDNIYGIANSIGFTNKRYIRLYPELFTNLFKQILYKHYAMEKFPMTTEHLVEDDIEKIKCTTNLSLDATLEIKSIAHSKALNGVLVGLLKEAHEGVKNELKAQRRNNKE